MDCVYQPHKAGLFIVEDERLLPIRKTEDSAGYDFFAPDTVEIPAHKYVQFDTGVRVQMRKGFVLMLFIRSSLGRKGLTLTNSVGIVDADYEDNMQAFIMNNSDEPYTINKGERYMQGIFTKFYPTTNDNATGKRTGGIGSTGK